MGLMNGYLFLTALGNHNIALIQGIINIYVGVLHTCEVMNPPYSANLPYAFLSTKLIRKMDIFYGAMVMTNVVSMSVRRLDVLEIISFTLPIKISSTGIEI